jgi:glycosyltransferase involved in cell wall biosynthesis
MGCPISVVLVFRNTGLLLGPSLASLAGERALGFELIAVDDGSRDGSPERLLRLCAAWPEVSLQLLRGTGQGFAAAAAQALKSCSAPLVAFLRPGDRFLAGRLGGAVTAFEDQPQLQQLHCGWQRLDQQGTSLGNEEPWRLHQSFSWSGLMQHRLVIPSCWTLQRQAALDAGNLNPRHGDLAPLDLALRLTGAWQPKVLVRHRLMPPPPWQSHLNQLQNVLEPQWQRLPPSHASWSAEGCLDLTLEGAAMAWGVSDNQAALRLLSQVNDWSAMPLARRAPRLLEHLHRISRRHNLGWARERVVDSPFWKLCLEQLQWS